MTFYMFHGIPASGKDTLARSRYPHAVVSNRDQIRTEVAGAQYHRGSPDKTIESQVTTIQRERMVEALHSGHDVVNTDTNLVPERIAQLVGLALDAGHHTIHIHVDTPVDECKRRNAKRERVVPEHVIDSMAKKGYTFDGHIKTFRHMVGTNRHGKRHIYVYTDRDPSNPLERELIEFNNTLEPASGEAIVFDMDGTLADVAELVERFLLGSKRDFESFHTQSEFAPPHQWVVDAAREAANQGFAVLVVTARQADYVGPTSRWLEKHGVPANRLYMRPSGDMRPDYDIKQEILDGIRAEGFTVVHAYDDNPAVLQMWGDNNIPTTVVPSRHWKV